MRKGDEKQEQKFKEESDICLQELEMQPSENQ
jgi:hypothetical protein